MVHNRGEEEAKMEQAVNLVGFELLIILLVSCFFLAEGRKSGEILGHATPTEPGWAQSLF